MSRIGTSIAGLEQFLLKNIASSDQAALTAAIRLATGNKINKASDDPAAFIQLSAFQHRQEIVRGTQANVEAATTIGAQTQLDLDQIRSQIVSLGDVLSLDQDQSLTSEERASNQLLIDAAIAEINRLAESEVGGKRYLSGEVNYRFAGQNAQQIHKIDVFSLRENAVFGSVDSAATQATSRYQGIAGNVQAADDSTLTIRGKRGSAAISVSGGESLADVAQRINQQSHKTGITAAANGDQLDLTTVDFGDSATLDIEVSTGSFATTELTQGVDATVTMNGETLDPAAIDGNTATYARNGTHLRIEFQAGFSGAFDPVTISDEAVAKFALSPEIADRTSLAFSTVSADALGGLSGKLSDLVSGGTLAGLGSNTSQALRVVDEALAQLTLVQARATSFADVTVASAAALLNGYDANLSDSINSINGINQDEESLSLAKNQVLTINSISAISLLQQQQASVLGLVRLLSGI